MGHCLPGSSVARGWTSTQQSCSATVSSAAVAGSTERKGGRNSKYKANILNHRCMAWQTQCWWCSNAVLVAMLGAENHPGMIQQLRVIIGQCIRRGKVPCMQCRGHLRGVWIAQLYSLYFSDQLSCIKFFHLIYGLKDIEFQSFNQFKSFSGFTLFINSTLSKTVLVDQSTDMWGLLTSGSHISYTVLIKWFN